MRPKVWLTKPEEKPPQVMQPALLHRPSPMDVRFADPPLSSSSVEYTGYAPILLDDVLERIP